jgi:Ca2+-binding EF-hand superfamily protein
LDKDASGALDIGELSRGLVDLGVTFTPPQLAAFHRDLDLDFDGAISLREFLVAVELRKPPHGARVDAWRALLLKISDDSEGWATSISALFDEIDVDKSGEIDIKELGKMVGVLGVRMTDAQASAFVDDIDVDCNGDLPSLPPSIPLLSLLSLPSTKLLLRALCTGSTYPLWSLCVHVKKESRVRMQPTVALIVTELGADRHEPPRSS